MLNLEAINNLRVSILNKMMVILIAFRNDREPDPASDLSITAENDSFKSLGTNYLMNPNYVAGDMLLSYLADEDDAGSKTSGYSGGIFVCFSHFKL